LTYASPFLSAEFNGDRVYECFDLKALAASVCMQKYVPFFELPPETLFVKFFVKVDKTLFSE